MSPLEIKIDLMRAGISMADIARQCGVTRQMISLVVSGKLHSDRVQAAIAAALGRDAAELFAPKAPKERRSAGKNSIRHRRTD